MIKSKSFIVLMLVLALFISINFYFLYLSNQSNAYVNEVIINNGDASHYYKIAQNIFDHFLYTDDDSVIATQSATWRPPFWPFLLSLFFYITTIPVKVVLIKMVVELLAIATVLYFICKKLKLKALYFVPFLLLLIEPQRLKYSVTFLSESITAVLILIFSVLFVTNNDSKKPLFFLTILAVLIVLCHPITLFFVGILYGIYMLSFLKSNLKIAILHSLVFVFLMALWPYRNFKTFNTNFYLTASQGATFAKGWNEKVATQFTNVDGDLADESMNLKFLSVLPISQDLTFLERSELYKKATYSFIKTLNSKQIIQIVFKKIKSNFNPFPEKPKPTFIDTLGIFFRCLYAFVFLQFIFRIFKRKFQIHFIKDRVFMVVFAIFLGQIIMSSFFYTGLRFNAVYGATLLFSFIFLNSKVVIDFILLKIFKYQL